MDNQKNKKQNTQNNERKVITKTDSSDYSSTREPAQKISFAKLQELLQRNVAKNVSKS